MADETNAQGGETPAKSRHYAEQVRGTRTVFDGIARHTPEGHAFVADAVEHGFRQAVRHRDDPFGDAGRVASGV